jgi:hypothetical protein
MGRHAAQPATFDAVVSDYVTGRAKELVREFYQFDAQPPELRAAFPMDWQTWCGSAVEILRELTRDA